MTSIGKNFLTRRQVVSRSVGAAAFGAYPIPSILGVTANAKTNNLRILRWKNFVPASETWFTDLFVKQWSQATGINVEVDNVGLGEINKVAAAEIEAGVGHDLVLFVSPRAALEDHVIDHREIVDECERLYGQMPQSVQRSCLNPKTKKFHGFPESFYPPMVTYRQDLWDAVGKTPSTWDEIRKGGRAIKLLHGSPVGMSLASEHNSEHTWRALLYSFGAEIQNQDGDVVLDSKNTIEALKFAKALFEEAMTPDTLSWGPSSNNQFMLSGSGNLTIDTMSIIRAAENKSLPVNKDLSLTLLPQGPESRIGPMFGLNTFVIWKFSENKENAKQFLIDFVGRFQESFIAGGFQNMPVYPASVPDLEGLILNDSDVPGRYAPLLQVFETIRNLGYPGYSNAAIDGVMGEGLIPKMFASAATGSASPEGAAREAASKAETIFARWRAEEKI